MQNAFLKQADSCMRKKYDLLKEDVADEMQAIAQVLADLAQLRHSMESDAADTIKNAAMGTFLMNFYNGIENIIKRISKVYYQTLPKGSDWHKELLALSCNPPQGKIPVFNTEIMDRLNPYREFRHLFVNGYGFRLRPERMLSLVANIDILWADIKQAIEMFWGNLQAEGLL